MSQTFNIYCPTHRVRATNICTEHHNCPDRRLCNACIEEHHQNIGKNKIVPIQAFHNDLYEKIRQGLAKFPSTQIFQIIHQLKQRLDNQFEELLKNAKNNFEQFTLSFNFISVWEFEKCQKYDFDIMIKVLKENFLEHQVVWYGKCYAAYQSHFKVLEDKLIQAFDQLDLLLKKISQENLKDNVLIKGPMVLGEKQGDFFYQYDDGSQQFAGKYFAGMKQGKWKEFIQFNKLVNKNQFHHTNYFYGEELSVNKTPFEIFDQDLKKQGKWFEINRFNNQKISYGFYQRGKKIDHWKDIYDGVCCGSGDYGQNEIKVGFWREAIENYNKFCQVVFLGSYSQGRKFGKWNSVYNGKILGQGSYNESEMKVGHWSVLHQNFSDHNQVIINGTYNYGVPKGAWLTTYKGQTIGGGSYNEMGLKIGQWTELHENFNDSLQITYTGIYENGLKKGEWLTQKNGKNLGGGEYDQKGLKSGQWIDIDAKLNDQNILSYVGTYKDGNRKGTWKILFNEKEIGGGDYDDQGMKTGKWIIPHETFDINCQVILKGSYKNDIQIGSWSTVFQDKIIGGGSFDDKGIKSGLWTDLHKNFKNVCQVTASVQYKNGIKQGDFQFYYCGKKIGGGVYNKEERKDGKWVDLDQHFQDEKQVTYEGTYRDGVRISQWTTQYKGSQIGGGSYDGNGVQVGQWVEIHENFNNQNQVTISGEYKHGSRYGEWKIIYRGTHIGGGLYDEDGLKTGIWTDLHENFYNDNQITQIGEYKLGFRFGQWTFQLNNIKIGGGQYIEGGIKNGDWIDLHQNFFNQNQITFQGQYRQGIKKGQWNIFYKNKKIGGGTYNNFGIKNGKWIDIENNFNQFSQVIYSGEYDNGVAKGLWETETLNL